MKLPRPTYAARTLLETYGAYHLARLAALPEQVDLSRDFGQAQEQLRERVEAHEKACAASMTAKAARDRQAAELNKAVRIFSLAHQMADGHPRTSARYKIYFPDGLSKVMTAAPEEKARRVARLLALLAQESSPDLRAHEAALASALSLLNDTLGTHTLASRAETEAFGLVQAEKLRWLDAYTRNCRALQARYVKDPAKAEVLFRSAPRGNPKKPKEVSA